MPTPSPRPPVDDLLRQYSPLVRIVARQSFPAHAGDPDLLQCGMIGLWEAAERWDGVPPFTPLARRCIKNNMLDHLRTLRRCPPPEEPHTPTEAAQDAAEEAEEHLDAQDLLTRIRSAWPPNSRERLVLTAIASGVSKSALAAALGLNTYQVTRIAKRAWKAVPTQEEGDP